jgi:thiamine biosynthesis lipoprotein
MRRLVLFLFFVLVSVLLFFNKNNINKNEIYITGTTMGPIVYNIKYVSKDIRINKSNIDSLLILFNNIFSTYQPTSYISTLNKSKSMEIVNPLFYNLLKESKKIYEATEGAFDPTIGPLVNAWGFGPLKKKNIPSKEEIDSIIKLVGFDKLYFDETIIEKNHKDSYIDFSSIAKGYAVDFIAKYFNDNNVKNYFIDIGGEVKCNGINSSGKIWNIGIENPFLENNSRKLIAAIPLKNLSLATSGNYRNYYVNNDSIIVHIINPKTGYPTESNMLSASVFSKDCFTSDAYATAFMVLDFNKAKEISKKIDEIDVFLVYKDSLGNINTYVSPNLSDLIDIRK